MKKDLSKLYDRLSGEERFKLTLAAIVRNDEGELEHLKRTCPRKDYSILDPACADRFEASQFITMAFAIDWMQFERAYSIARLCTEMAILAIRKYLDGYSKGISAVKDPDNSYEPFNAPGDEKLLTIAESELPKEYTDTLQAKKGELKGILTAFDTFCQDIDVPIDNMLAWMPHIKRQVDIYRPMLADVQPDEEATQPYLRIYRDSWTKKTGQQFEDATTVA